MKSTHLTHAQLASSISLDRERLAGLLGDADRDYDRLLEKLDTHAADIAETMARLRASIARSRETDPSTLSINGLGELQGQGPALDRLCGEVEAQRDLVRRLNEVLLPDPPQTGDPA
jgi:hypothetical protein